MAKTVWNCAVALLIGACGGGAFAVMGAPLPWTLGSLTASALAAALFNRWPMPSPVRNAARPVVGVLAGSAFTPATIALLTQWWPAVLVVLCFSLATSVIGYLVFTCLARIDRTTAYFAATPGGLGELSLLGASLGGNVRTIALIHSVRIVAVVFAVPFFLPLLVGHEIVQTGVPNGHQIAQLSDWLLLALAGGAGYLLGRYAAFPGGGMVAAMLCSAAIHVAGLTSAAPPQVLVVVAQILIGSVTGARFAGITLRELRTTVLVALGWSVFLLLATSIVAAFAARLMGMELSAMLLAMAPGGTAEMIIITYALGAEVAFVSICQISRVFLILTFAPMIHRMFFAQTSP